MDPLFPTIGNVETVELRYVPPIRRIQLEVCKEYGITLNDMLSGRVDANLTRARKVAMQRARARTEASYPQLGNAFRRHHTTVMHACGALRRNRK